MLKEASLGFLCNSWAFLFWLPISIFLTPLFKCTVELVWVVWYAGGRGSATVGGLSMARGGMAGVGGIGSGPAGSSRGGGFPQPGQSPVAQHTSA